MSEFEKTIKEAGEPKDTKKSYGEVVRERRAKLNELSAKTYSDIACDRKAFVAMLDTASRFLRNSVGNIMLIYAQNPKATELRTYNEWKQKEKIVKKGATQVYVLKKKEYTDSEGKTRVGYDPEGKFDVLDTVDGQAAPAPKYDEKTLVRGLVHACSAKVVVDADFPQSNPEGAAYIKDKNEIRCKYGMPLDELVPTVLNAAALATFCGGAKPPVWQIMNLRQGVSPTFLPRNTVSPPKTFRFRASLPLMQAWMPMRSKERWQTFLQPPKPLMAELRRCFFAQKNRTSPLTQRLMIVPKKVQQVRRNANGQE